jgi:NAD(P)-dependent dehydrogenase (short-subunit alcohol dehydrogenase family)
MELNNCSAIVTGGASGLGEATVKSLISKGVHVTIFDLKQDQAEKLANELGDKASFSVGDVTKESDVLAALEVAKTKAPFRIAINCAGIGWAQRTVDKAGNPHSMDAFETIIRVNLLGTFNVLRLAAAEIAKADVLEHNERGVIVNTASVAAFDGQIGQIAYSASKGGIVGLTLPAARDLSALGIRVLTIAPGLMDTPLLALLPEPQRKALGDGVLFPKRLGFPAEYAALATHMCENSYLNGETVRLDGGLRMPPK